MRKFVGIALLVALALSFAEGKARWDAASSVFYIGDERLAIHRPDVTTIWRYRPNIDLSYQTSEFEMVVRTDERGFRSGRSLPIGLSDEAIKILVIGDSFAFGWGVAAGQRFSEVLARSLEVQYPKTKVQLINTGHMSYAFDQQLVLMKELIERYHPQIVVQDLYWMHIRSFFNHRLGRSAEGKLRSVTDPTVQIDEHGRLKVRSDWYWHRQFGSQLAATMGIRAEIPSWIDFMRPRTLKTKDLWLLTDAIVGETIDTLRAAQIAYVPFLVPTAVEVGGSNWKGVGWTEPLPPNDVDIALPASRLGAIFARQGIQVIDLTQALHPEDYYSQDGHWNATGHQHAAEALLRPVSEALARSHTPN